MIIDVKYKDIVDRIIGVLQQYCCNINDNLNYSKIPSQFRTGYSQVYTFSRQLEYPKRLTVSLKGQGVQVYSRYEVEYVLEEYFNNYLRKVKKIFNVENEITPNGILSFFEALNIFCNSTIKFYVSSLVPNSSLTAFYPTIFPTTIDLSNTITKRIDEMVTNKVLLSSIVDTLIEDVILLQKGQEYSRTTLMPYNFSAK